MDPSVYIILLNYKGYEYTTACVHSLQNITYDNYKIIIVDNCSNDGSFERLRDENPDVVVLLAEENNGFSAGNNIGIRYAMEHGSDFVLLLNNDTEVDPYFLQKMVKASDLNTVVTPTIYYYDDKSTIWYADGKINKYRATVSNGTDKESKYCSYASGCCVLIPRNIIHRVGYWAEEYFMYYEDMDYSLRVQHAGFKIYYEHEAIIYHKVGKSAGVMSKLSIYYNVRNRFYIIEKYNFGRICYLYSLITRMIKYIFGIIFGTNEAITKKAYFDFLSKKMNKVFFD